MELKITNESELDNWINERIRLGHDLHAIKGQAPLGSTYSDGDPITRPVTIAWRDSMTGEVFAVEYQQSGEGEK